MYSSSEIETSSGDYKKIHSNTSREQCLFLQQLFDRIKPEKSIEVGLAFGISALAILEKHKEKKSADHAHIIIEPYSWDGVAEFNIEKEGLMPLAKIFYETSERVLPKLGYDGLRVQFAYIDTTKVFDTILSDFYFIDKILDKVGVVIFDDCGGSWPGVQKVVRFVSTLPNYQILRAHGKIEFSFKKKLAEMIVNNIFKLVPFKEYVYPAYNFKSDTQLGLNYSCIAFQKIEMNSREWNWDRPF